MSTWILVSVVACTTCRSTKTSEFACLVKNPHYTKIPLANRTGGYWCNGLFSTVIRTKLQSVSPGISPIPRHLSVEESTALASAERSVASKR